jgi:hypothetical protein
MSQLTKDMTRLTDALSVTNDQGYGHIKHWLTLSYHWSFDTGNILVYLVISLVICDRKSIGSQIPRDMTMLTDILSVTYDQGYYKVNRYCIFHK